MRTTLDIDDDVLDAAKEVARRQKTTTGKVVSALLRQGFGGSGPAASPIRKSAQRRNAAGFKPLPPRGGVVSNDLVNRLRDQEGI